MLLFESGKYNSLPHYVVDGTDVEFRVYVRRDPLGLGHWSAPIAGQAAKALHDELRKLNKSDPRKFCMRVCEVLSEHPLR